MSEFARISIGLFLGTSVFVGCLMVVLLAWADEWKHRTVAKVRPRR